MASQAFHHPDPTPGGASFVLFAGPPETDALVAALASALTDVEVLDAAGADPGVDAVIVGRLGPDEVLVVPVGVPVPDDEALAACHPVWWDDPSPVADHAGHAMVVVRSEDDDSEDARTRALRQAMTQSVAVAALLALPDAVGVHVSAAGATFPPREYVDVLAAARSARHVPVDLWVTTWLEPHDDDSVSGYTRGLTTFGHADLVVEDSDREPSAVYNLLASLAEHVVMTGERLDPGHTIGWDDGVHPVAAADDSSGAHPLLVVEF